LIKHYLSLVKFAHTVYAMPFALLGLFMAFQEGHDFKVSLLLKVILTMVFARNAAMGFNRYLDRDYDGRNERTRQREIPAGIISAPKALIFVWVNSIAFLITTWFINPLCFYLSPVALMVVLGYSYTKRFTALCHLVLGLGLALAPIGAWLAVTESFAWAPVLLSVVVFTWVSGFDIVYALQDRSFDLEHKLNSIPVWLGMKGARVFSMFLHLLSTWALLALGLMISGGLLFWLGAAFYIVMLVYQHTLVKTHDLSRVNIAFMTTNGIISVIFSGLAILDLYWKISL